MKNHCNHYLIPQWPAPSYIKAYVTTRSEGCSLAPFDEFNFGEYVGDNPEALHKNRQRLNQELQLPNEPYWLKQVHGTRAVCLDEPENFIEADAAYALIPQKVCAVTTADCLPLLVCSTRSKTVAAIHAGWKGLLAGVIESTIKAMNSPAQDLMVWLGPVISQKNFEVDLKIKELFCKNNSENVEAFIENSSEHFQADLYSIAKKILKNLGIKKIYGGDYCTYEDKDLFYSYRREKVTGRMASLIWSE